MKTINQIYHKRISVSKSSTKKVLEASLKHLGGFNSGLKLLSDITLQDVEEFKYYLLNDAKSKWGKPISQNTANSYYVGLKTILSYAYNLGLINKDLGKLSSNIGIEEVPRMYLDEAEIEALLSTKTNDEQLKRCAYVSLTTGMRFSDVSNLEAENLVMEDDALMIKFKQKKTAQYNIIPVGLKTFHTAKEFVDNKENSYNYHAMRYNLIIWFEDAGVGVKKAFFHIFRHTFANMQIKRGTDIYTISDLLGHKSINTTQIYAKASMENKKNAILEI